MGRWRMSPRECPLVGGLGARRSLGGGQAQRPSGGREGPLWRRRGQPKANRSQLRTKPPRTHLGHPYGLLRGLLAQS